MTIYSTRRGAHNYGFAVGILQLDCSLPFIPGDVDNATTYDYPVIYRTIPELSTISCLRGAPEMTKAVVPAATIRVVAQARTTWRAAAATTNCAAAKAATP